MQFRCFDQELPGTLMLKPIPDEPALDMQAAARLVLANWRRKLQAAWGPVLLSGGPETIVQVTPLSLEVYRSHAEQTDLVGSVPVESNKPDIRVLRALAERAGSAEGITLRLPAEAVLRPRLTLPYAGRDAMLGALGFEIERISPVPPQELYYDYTIASRTQNLADLELRLVKRHMLDGHLAACHAAGLTVAAIAFEGDPRMADWRSFPIDRSARIRVLLQRYRRIGIIGLAALLLIAVLIGAYERQSAALDAAISASVEAGQRAARVEKLKHTITLASTDLGYAAAQKQSPLLVSVLAELTQILPDGTSVNEMTFDGKTVRITGLSGAAADLIGLIDRSPKFRSARFEAPLVHDQAGNTDRFDLSFQLRGR
jgi:general secretion pathway protein L